MVELKSKEYWISKNEDSEEIVIYISFTSLAEQLSQQGCIVGKAKDEIIIHIPAPQEKEVGELTIIKGILRTIIEGKK